MGALLCWWVEALCMDAQANVRMKSMHRVSGIRVVNCLTLNMQVRCIWRVVLPLLDAGYQVDVRVLNSVYYGVPQTRRVRSRA